MSKLLIYGNRKQDDDIYDISTPEKELAAYLAIFATLDGYWSVYADLGEIEEPKLCEPCAKELHKHCEGKDTDAGCSCIANEDCAKRARRAAQEHHQNVVWKKWYDEAKAGNGESAKKLMKDRSGRQYEYEELRTVESKDPLEVKPRGISKTQTP